MKTLHFDKQGCRTGLLVLLALWATSARADQERDFTFSRNDASAVLTGYTGPGGVVVIPDRLGNLPVANIGSNAFYGRRDLTSITIPNSVTSIGQSAFGYCTGLTSVTIPDSVTAIGLQAFSGCTGLTSVTIPNSVTAIGGRAFSWCTGLTSVTIPNSVTSIGSVAFSGCTGLTSVTIPNSVTAIGEYAFGGCTGLRAIEVDSLNVTYSSASGVLFNKAQSVLILYPAGKAGPYTIPDNVSAIGYGAFRECTGLTSVTIPNSVTSIEWGAFFGCTGLTSVTIPNSVTAIGWSAFFGCTGLTSVTIPTSVTFIDQAAFSDCTGLTSVTIPNSVTVISYEAFSGCTGLSSVTIPDSVTVIGAGAFSGCTGLTSVTIPTSVTAIEDQTFYGCTGLTSVTIPTSVTAIVSGAFSGCTGLRAIEVDSLNVTYSSASGVLFNKAQSVLILYPAGKAGPYTIPDNVTAIGYGAFSGCTGLTSVTIPNSVTAIGEYAFGGCTGLMAIEVDTHNAAYSSRSGVLFDKAQSVLILYPAGKAGPYTIPNSVAAIGSYAFSGCTGLTSLTIPNSVTAIGSYAFSGCTGLTSVTIPNSVTSIGEYAFWRCAGLTSVYFEGTPPRVDRDPWGGGPVFEGSAVVTVFYRAGAAGWTATFWGRPTAVWVPRPAFGAWAVSTGLTTLHPDASAEGDDPDGDGVANGAEWFAGTDPTQRASRLELELAPRPAELSAADQTPLEPGQHAVYFHSVPDRYYGVERSAGLGGAWELQATKVATTAQTRFVLPQPPDHSFYRVLALP